MNITRLNFNATLPLVKETIGKAHFLAFDLEMSGIQTEELTTPSIVDSTQKRYEKQKQSIHKFIPLQFGLSAFQVQPQQSKILAFPFNFYIYPLTQPNETTKFSFHAGTMTFLTKNQFDFNQLFYEGIPYVSQEKLKQFQRQDQINSFRSQLKKLKQVESPEVKAFIKINLPIVEEWLASSSSSLQLSISHIKQQSYLLLKEKIEEKNPNASLHFSYDHQQYHKRTKLIIQKCSQQQKQSLSSISNSPLDSSELFNEVFDEVVSSKKPLIVHNGFLDLMHVYLRFHESLPETWSSYKEKVHSMFPCLYDNKYLFANSPTLSYLATQKMTGLENCFTGMCELAKKEERSGEAKVKIEIAEDFKGYSLDSLQCHEAGFDSLMTGFSFLKGVTHLNDNLNILTDSQAFNETNSLFRNRIPQGSIKVPFNFQENNEDIYTKDGNSPIFFRSVLNRSVEEAKIVEFFSQNYGSVNMLWTSRELTEFCIIFLSEQVKEKFENHLSTNCKIGNTSILSLEGVEFLVFSAEQHQRLMNNAIGKEEGQQQNDK